MKMKMPKVSTKLNKRDLITRVEIKLGLISDEAAHALDTEADKPLEVFKKNMKAIQQYAREALKDVRSAW
jgi:hypothetical protein